jgi:hypothetical protein
VKKIEVQVERSVQIDQQEESERDQRDRFVLWKIESVDGGLKECKSV